MCAKRTATSYCHGVNIFPRIFLLAGRGARTHATRAKCGDNSNDNVNNNNNNNKNKPVNGDLKYTRAFPKKYAELACRQNGASSTGTNRGICVGGSSPRRSSSSHARGGALAVTRPSFGGLVVGGGSPYFRARFVRRRPYNIPCHTANRWAGGDSVWSA